MITWLKFYFTNVEVGNYWRSIRLLACYRLTISTILVSLYFFTPDSSWLSTYNIDIFAQTSALYFVFSVLTLFLAWLKWPKLNHLVTLLTLADISFILLILLASGGSKSGYGLLLVSTIALASLISQGRLALFHAAVASIGLLLIQAYQVLTWGSAYAEYTQAALLSMGLFATAWLAHTLAKRSKASEALAEKRGVDLENLSHINALITQEMNDGVLVFDTDLNLLHHNPKALLLLLGESDHELENSASENVLFKNSVSEKSAPKNKDPEKSALTISVEVNLNHAIPDLKLLIKDWLINHHRVDTLSYSSPVTGRSLKCRLLAQQTGVVVFLQDFSQVQTQAQQMKLAALGRLTANVAHEIRNPLSAISHANQLLQETVSDSASQRLVNIINDNVERLNQMVTDILELNRRDRTNQQQFALNDFLLEFYEQFCPAEKVPAESFALELPEANVQIYFDRRHLNQICWNLCKNGWRHCSQNRHALRVIVQLNHKKSLVTIEVINDGDVIAEETRAHLFEPFFTTESTGTGLGLYIAKELTEANNATISCMAVEAGALFKLEIKMLNTTLSRNAPNQKAYA